MLPANSKTKPAISVVIPTYNRLRELQLCLRGFSKQNVEQSQFEVIVVDDGSACDLRPVAEELAGAFDFQIISISHAGIAAARNEGLDRARAPLLVLYDDDQRPAPDLIEYCLSFHDQHPAQEDAALLYFTLDPEFAGTTFADWAFGQLYAFPESACISGWTRFWGGTLSCKKSIFDHGRFDPAFQMLEDTEMGLRLSRNLDLRVHFEPQVTGMLTRSLVFDEIWRRQYMIGYYSYVFEHHNPKALNFAWPPFDVPEKYVIQDTAKLTGIHAIGRAAASNNVRSGPSPLSKLAKLSWATLDLHARAEGWMHARDGRSASPPGSIAAL